MTAIISWLNMENGNNPSIWTIGDTMISKNGGALTLLGNKIHELPIRCKDITTIPQEYYFSGAIGFAYAGSTLIGMNVYAFLIKILSNLGGFKSSNHLPDALSICKKAEEILKLYIGSISDLAEIMIFGICPKNNNPFICTIKARNNETKIGYEFNFKDNFLSNLEVMHIGSEYEKIIDMINVKLEENKKVPIKYWRTPKEVLEEIINLGESTKIGGGLELIITSKFWTNSFAITKPIEGMQPIAEMKLSNVSLGGNVGGNVGECCIAIYSMC